MGSLWDNITTRFKQGNVVIKFLFINIGVFLLLRLTLVFIGLFKVNDGNFMSFLQMPSDVNQLIRTPWTVFTYMFVHLDLMHILFNMLWLYFFGGMFLRWFNARQLTLLYIIGGLFGALFFALFYNILPAYKGIDASLMGASASILALGIAVAIFRPDEPVPMFLLGVIKLKWLAIAMVVMDLLSLNGDNAGGNLAHIGGAVAGLIFGLSYRQNKDIFSRLNPLMNGISSMFKPKPKMKVTYQRPRSEKVNHSTDVDQDFRDRRKGDAEMLDVILDKIKKSGYDSLTQSEKRFLFDSSKHI